MTDNEIIKDLEHYISEIKELGGGSFSGAVFAQEILDLINRLKASDERNQKRNSNLKHALFEQQSYTAELQKELATAKEENEKLVNIPPKDPMDFCGVVCNYAEELIEKAKSKARKEFAEFLKARKIIADTSNYYGKECITDVITVEDIDNLLKEMG